MSDERFVIGRLERQERSGFDCGVEALDRYFCDQVGQDVRRRLTVCFVLEERATGLIAGYYTLSAASILLTELPAALARKLPRYPAVPAARIGRLAVDVRFHGQKLGSALLSSAACRAAASDVAVFAVVVDAKDDAAAAFYRHHGFVAYASADNRMIAPLRSLVQG